MAKTAEAGVKQRPRTLAELEHAIGVQRTTPPSPTQRDVANLTARRLRGPFWKKKR